MAADVWSVTSYNELRRDALGGRAMEIRLHPDLSPQRHHTSWKYLKNVNGPIVAATDYMKIVPDQIGSVVAWTDGVARHRRLRTQRQP